MYLAIACALCTILLPILGICLHRLFWHAFAPIPGPFWAKISNGYSAYHAAKQDTHVIIQRLHEKYGSVVRYGPDRLLFNSREAMEDIYGQQGVFFKGRAYDAMRIQPEESIFNMSDDVRHDRRRKVIAKGFSDAAVKACQPVILRHVGRYCDALFEDSHNDIGSWTESRNLTEWSAYFAVDLITDLVVGRSANMLGSPANRIYNEARKANFRRMGLAIQWPEAFLQSRIQPLKLGELLFPSLATRGREWHALLSGWIDMRIIDEYAGAKAPVRELPLTTLIIRHRDSETGKGLSNAELKAELTTLLIAGSGTITTGLTSLIWYLSRDPTVYRRAVDEVRGHFDSLDDIRIGARLNACVYLRACLQEAMRMSPAPTTPLYRESGSDQATVCGVRIPKGCEVGTTIYALHHNEAYYEDSFHFRPERWMHEEKHDSTKSAWAPFSYGPRKCIGMSLAMNELLLAMASLLWQGDFKISIDPDLGSIGAGGQSLGPGRCRKGEFQSYDTFGASTEGPYLQFRRRVISP